MRENELSEVQRERIIGAYLSGTKQTVILTQLGSAIPEKRPGHPKSLTQRDKQTLQRIIRDNWFSPLGDITNRLNFSFDITLHNNTSRDKRNWRDEWKQIIWSDESRFALFESDGRVRVWRSPGEAYNKDCILPTVKFEGGSQDGASYYTSNYSIWWITTHNIPILDWELINVIQEEWRKISIETVHGLISSLSNRVNAVIKAKGGHTKY
ncbi:helix-turn-helix domain-containing protein [Rhizophagus irregularis DAOM 181602=DAOM 197198]|nr:helix-turn-helix domain-containing protein [Rhizophagus irregularis DAOM 181602=DAOM 197198]